MWTQTSMALGVLWLISITSAYAEQHKYASIVTPIVQRNLETVSPLKPLKPLKTCPPGFPNLDLGDKHGDVCRNTKLHGFNVGWSCPNQCKPTGGNPPYCKVSNSNNSPCRVERKK